MKFLNSEANEIRVFEHQMQCFRFGGWELNQNTNTMCGAIMGGEVGASPVLTM